MMQRLIQLTLAIVLIASFCAAAPILTLTPAAGNVSGEPGSVAGWGFTLTADPNEWITVVSSFLLFETNPDLGFYEDYIGLQGGLTDGILDPGGPNWVQSFSANQAFGIGAFFLSPLASSDDRNDAKLIVVYERFSADPSTCSTCNLGSGEFSFDVSITAGTNPVPEPGTLSLLALVLVIAGAAGYRRSPPL